MIYKELQLLDSNIPELDFRTVAEEAEVTFIRSLKP